MTLSVTRVLVLLAASAQALVLPAIAPSPHATRQPAVSMQVGDEKKSSTLNVSQEQLAERNEKKALVNRLLPVVVVGAFALNALTGGAAFQIEIKGPEIKGMAEAKALKAKSEAKSAAAYDKMKQDLRGK